MPFRVSGVIQPTSTHNKVTDIMGPNRVSCSEHPRRMRSSYKLPNRLVCCAKSTSEALNSHTHSFYCLLVVMVMHSGKE